MAKSKLFLVVTIILSTSGVEPKAIGKEAPYPPSGFRPQGRAFNLPGEEEFATTTESFLETTTEMADMDFTTTEFPEGVNRLGRAFTEEDEEGLPLTTIKPGIAQIQEGEKLEIVYSIPASDSLKLGVEETTTVLPDDEVTTFAPVDSSQKCIECKLKPDDEIATFAPIDDEHKLVEEKVKVTKLFPIDESKLGELRISDEEIAIREAKAAEEEPEPKIAKDVTTFAPVNEEETADLKSQVETIDPQEFSAEAEKLTANEDSKSEKKAEEEEKDSVKDEKKDEEDSVKDEKKDEEPCSKDGLKALLESTKEADEEEGLAEEVSVASSEKVVMEHPSLPAETKYSRFYLVNDGTLNDYEYIHQHYEDSANDEPLVISQQEVLVPADQPFVYSAQIQRWA